MLRIHYTTAPTDVATKSEVGVSDCGSRNDDVAGLCSSSVVVKALANGLYM